MTAFNMKNLSFVILMSLLLLLLLDRSEGQSNQDCCLSYSKKPLPRKAIKGFTEQFSSEVCELDAIIFNMRNGVKACANPKHKWVRDHLCWLR
uniref:C-C motif chemokine n=1 Tax=Salvator merianae TaxID=96440 RepID=A0A8D0BIJ0_SALMN